MRRVLVTGATGGLGLAVVERLAAGGTEVVAGGRDPNVAGRLADLGARFVPGDLTDAAVLPRLLDGVDGVIHCAALSSPWGAYADFHRINVTATADLLAAARAAGVGRFVFVSSPSVYARPADQVGLTEDHAPNPRPMNAYAATKGEAERAVLAASGPDMACVAVRPRAVIGPDDKVVLPRILRLVRQGRFPLLRQGRALIEPTDSRDAAEALVTGLDRAETLGGQVINISGGRALPVRGMVEALAGEIGRAVRFVAMPWPAVAAAVAAQAWLCERMPGRPEPPVTPYSLTTVAFSQTFDLARARRLLDYAPRHDAFATALEVARRRADAG